MQFTFLSATSLFFFFFTSSFKLIKDTLTFERLRLLVSFLYRVNLSFSFRVRRCGFIQIYSKVIEFI